MKNEEVSEKKGRNMRMTILTVMALALTAGAQEYEARSGSTTTSNTVTVSWGGKARPLRLVSVDATSDMTGSALTWRVGTTPSPVVVAATAAATNVVCLAGSLASNDVCLLQNASGVVTQATVWGTARATNATLTFEYPLGTNCAVGSKVHRLDPDYFRVVCDIASNSTTLYVDKTNYLGENTNIVIDLGGTVWLDPVFSLTPAASYAVALKGETKSDLADGNLVFVVGNGTNLLGNTAANSKSLHVKGTNTLAQVLQDDYVMVVAGNGLIAVGQVDTTTVATNITLKANLGIAATASGRVYFLRTAGTVMRPQAPGARTVHLSATNSANVDLVFVPAAGQPWRARTAAAAVLGATYELEITNPLPAALAAGTRIYGSTNSVTLVEVAGKAANTVVVAAATGLAAGDQVAVVPSTGGTFLNRYQGTATRLKDTVSFTAATGLALAVGDQVFASTASTAGVGVGSVHWFGEAVFLAPSLKPAVLSLDCGTNGAINNAVGFH